MWCIITGNIIDGVGIVGPFETADEAIQYAEDAFGNDLDWNVAEMVTPEK